MTDLTDLTEAEDVILSRLHLLTKLVEEAYREGLEDGTSYEFHAAFTMGEDFWETSESARKLRELRCL
jgi:hypothetical protein